MRIIFFLMSCLLIIISNIYGDDLSAKKKLPYEGTILAGTFCHARLLFVADTPIEGSSSGNRPFIAMLEGYATSPSGNKIDMDKNFIIGYGMGDAVDDRIALSFSRLTYYFNGSPEENDVNGYASVNGKAGIPSMKVISKEGEDVIKIIAASTLEAMSIAFQRGLFSPEGFISTNNIASSVESSAGTTAFSNLADYYLKLMSSQMPELQATNATEIEVVFMKSFDYMSKDFVNNEENK